MKASLAAGVTATKKLTVDRERTIDFMGEKARVYATPMLVRDMEIACRELLLQHLDPGEDSVGTRVELDHLAATLMGMSVELTVTLVEVKGRVRDVERRGTTTAWIRSVAARTIASSSTSEPPRHALRPRPPKAGPRMSASRDGTRRVPTYCYQCVAGPDLLTVKVQSTAWPPRSSPISARRTCTRPAARSASKPMGWCQKTYNPHRVLAPMKRTNPHKGRDEDPGFVPISWDEAMELIAARLNARA